MMQHIRFDDLKRRTYLTYHEDGVADVLFGAGTLCFGLGMLRPDSSLWMLTWLFVLLYVPIKNRVTVPRLGYVRFDPETAASAKGALTVILGVFFLAGIVAFQAASASNEQLRTAFYHYFPVILGSLGTAALAAAAAALGIRRYYGYAAVAAALALGAQLGLWSLEIAVTAMGAAALVAGLTLLARFVRRYPVSAMEPNHGG